MDKRKLKIDALRTWVTGVLKIVYHTVVIYLLLLLNINASCKIIVPFYTSYSINILLLLLYFEVRIQQPF